jgi:hypothetical protein
LIGLDIAVSINWPFDSSLKQQSVIQKWVASLLLVVFAISITPKAYFHEVIARHKDVSVCTHPPQAAHCIHKQGFNCHFDDLVVTAPFLLGKAIDSFDSIARFPNMSSVYKESFLACSLLQKKGRAPPAV